ncbi:MAG: DNA repair exonuclease [Chloroflexi bacterium]|nr:DNA repair exonuclease [Chloroflexota bacterium]
MTRIRFVHAADLHLDSPFGGLRSIAPEIAETLYQATFDAYDNIIELCIKEQADALLVAGDIFDSADRSLRAQLKFVDGLNRLEKAGIRSFICHGNHDPLNGWEAQLTFPEGCHRFGAAVERVPIFQNEPGRAAVYGISYPQREVSDNLARQFVAAGSEQFSIGLLHANVDNNADHEAYAPCTIRDLEDTGMDYWALGHVHTRQVLREANPTVVYPGNPQGRHPNEPDARGVYIVDVDDAGRVRLEFRAVDVVRWATLEIDISELETDQSLFDKIDHEIAQCQDNADGRDIIFRLVLNGRGPLHDSLRRPGFVDDLLERVNDTGPLERPFLWCERIQASTASLIDREQQRQRSDFVGDLVRLCDEWQATPDGLSEIRENLQELYGRGNAGRYLRDHVPTEDELRELMASAEAACLAELLEEGGT